MVVVVPPSCGPPPLPRQRFRRSAVCDPRDYTTATRRWRMPERSHSSRNRLMTNPAGEPQTAECAPCLHEIIMRASSGLDTHVRQIGW